MESEMDRKGSKRYFGMAEEEWVFEAEENVEGAMEESGYKPTSVGVGLHQSDVTLQAEQPFRSKLRNERYCT